MDREMMDGAKEEAKGVITDFLDDMRDSFQIERQSRRDRLTPKEQLDIFLSMSEADLQKIREEKGEDEYMRYLSSMNTLMEEERNA